MKRYLTKSLELMMRDEVEMRSFYESCGISPRTTEAAILARRNKPFDEAKPSVFKGKRRKPGGSAPSAKKLAS